MSNELLLWLLPLPPLLAFAFIVLFLHRSNKASHTVAILGVVLSWLGSMVLFFRALGMGAEALAAHPIRQAIAWLPQKTGLFTIGVYLDPLTAITLFFVAWTIVMIFVYSVGYHNYGAPRGDHDEKGLPPHGATVEEHGHRHKVPSIEPMYARFFAYVSLFAFGMYLLVVSDNLLTLFAGWEIMGLCSFLLIGFWFKKPSARDAAVKAFMTTRIGDVFMLLGIVYLYTQTGSLAYPEVFAPETLERLAITPAWLGFSAAGLIALLLFIGTVGKSAQWPLHVWLPDAMEGPTPVSAMIHAATMVSAGVYLIIRIFPLLNAAAAVPGFLSPMPVIAFIGAFTALFAATIAVTQNDIKRVLAYSTISQLGYMVAAVGIGAYVAAAFHLVTHAFFKALLFLSSGSVIHGMEHGALHAEDHIDPQNMYNMGGLKERMPITFWAFLIGGFALAGFPVLTSGFWSKDEILSDAFKGGHMAVFWTLALAALLTAFYTMRQITLTFLGKPRTQAAEHAHETPRTMTVPLMILAVFALGYGWVGVPKYFPVLGGLLPDWFQRWLEPLFVMAEKGEKAAEAVKFSPVPLLVSITVSLTGLALGYLVYRQVERADQPDPLARRLGGLYTLLQNKYYFDELYQALFVRPAYWLAEVFTFRWLDRTVIDGVLHVVARASVGVGRALRDYIDLPIVNGFGDAVGEGTKGFGRLFRAVQTGRVQQYMLVALAHLVAFLVLVYYVATMS